MKLNQWQKSSIVRSIFNDVKHASSADIKKAVQAELVKAMSPACQKAYKVCPNALKSEYTYDLTFERDRLTFIVGDADYEKIFKPWNEAKQKYISVKQGLENFINSCSTLKQLQEALPEFLSYFPTENTPTRNLPVVANLVADLVKLGWKQSSNK